MQEISKIHVGLDVHKDSIAIAAAAPGREAARVIAMIGHDVAKLLKVLSKLGAAQGVHVVYEAGPTGWGLQRALTAKGYVCEVIAPSKMPRRPGDRIKTDRRDCVQLAECSRAGQLRAVWVPQPADEAIGDLARARAKMRSTPAGSCASNSRASCCATTCATPARPPGPRCTASGWAS